MWLREILRGARGSRFVQWLVPLIATTAAPLTVFAGDLANRIYLDHLRVPTNALEFTTADRMAAGARPMLLLAVAMVGCFGFYGLLRWLNGPIAVLSIILGSLAVATLLLLVVLSGRVLADLAKPDLGGVPRGWAGLRPYCARVTPISSAVVNEGYRIDLGKPWVMLGEGHDRYVLWREREGHRRLPADRFEVSRADPKTESCSAG